MQLHLALSECCWDKGNTSPVAPKVMVFLCLLFHPDRPRWVKLTPEGEGCGNLCVREMEEIECLIHFSTKALSPN